MRQRLARPRQRRPRLHSIRLQPAVRSSSKPSAVILSGVPSRAEAAEGRNGGWWTASRGTERSRRIPKGCRAFHGVLRLRCARLSASASLRMTRVFGNDSWHSLSRKLPARRTRAHLRGMRFRIFPLLAALVAAPLLRGADAGRPNILFIISDDQRFDCVGALGHPDVKTPATDALVRRGFTFTNCYCMGSMIGAVCTPSRTMLMTGRSLWRIPEPRGPWENLLRWVEKFLRRCKRKSDQRESRRCLTKTTRTPPHCRSAS